jgi:hypothetical protein
LKKDTERFSFLYERYNGRARLEPDNSLNNKKVKELPEQARNIIASINNDIKKNKK